MLWFHKAQDTERAHGKRHSLFYILPGHHQPSDYRFPRRAKSGEGVCLRVGCPADANIEVVVDDSPVPGICDETCGQDEMLYEFMMPDHDVTVIVKASKKR